MSLKSFVRALVGRRGADKQQARHSGHDIADAAREATGSAAAGAGHGTAISGAVYDEIAKQSRSDNSSNSW